jgi:hypothetical protein
MLFARMVVPVCHRPFPPPPHPLCPMPPCMVVVPHAMASLSPQRGVMNLLGAFNQSITDRAIEAMAAGDARAVGALMTEAQVGEGCWCRALLLPPTPPCVLARIHICGKHLTTRCHVCGGGVHSACQGAVASQTLSTRTHLHCCPSPPPPLAPLAYSLARTHICVKHLTQHHSSCQGAAATYNPSPSHPCTPEAVAVCFAAECTPVALASPRPTLFRPGRGSSTRTPCPPAPAS